MSLYMFLKMQIKSHHCADLAEAFLYFITHSFHNRNIGTLKTVELALKGCTLSFLGGKLLLYFFEVFVLLLRDSCLLLGLML